MAARSLGKVAVTTAGTIVRVTATKTLCHAIRIQTERDNTGYIIIGTSDLVTSTYVGCLGVLGIPAATGEVPYLDLTLDGAANGLNAADIWLDSTVNGDGAIITVLEQ